MKILFLGGDKRQIEIINHLNKKGYEIDVIGYTLAYLNKNINKKTVDVIKINEYDVIFFPISGVKENYYIVSDFENEKIFLDPNFLKEVKSRALIFTGINTQCLDEMLLKTNKKTIALMEDDQVKKENSIPTVEGIIGDLVYNTDQTINGSNIFVLGYGNVGTVLVDKLKCLGANITVGVLLFEEYQMVAKKGLNCIYTNNQSLMQKLVHNSDIIINTVPDLIINKEYLKVVNKDAYILDISSHPHGVDFDSANELQIKNKLLLGIPGKVAPKTAGLILVNKIDSILERSK
jgi:dipicolinate synthase subunit A